jgi:hypothetical protein
MLAEGDVDIDSPQLTGATERLEIWFQQLAEEPVAAVERPARKTDPPTTRSPGAAPGLAAEEEPVATSPLDSIAGKPGEPKRSYDVRGKLIRMQVAMRGKQSAVSDVAVDGDVVFRETKTAPGEEQPLLIRGDQLQVSKAETPATRVTIAGRPAHIEARGMTTEGPSIHFDRGTNRIWMDNAGTMKVPMRRDLQGAPTPGEQTMLVNWRGRMDFDGRTMRFDRQVDVRGDQQLLRTETLDVQLNQRIDFSKRNQGDSPKVEAREIFCRGGVFLENRGVDEQGIPTSIDRLQSNTLKLNQATGEIFGQGPGWVTSVRTGGATELQQPSATPPNARTPVARRLNPEKDEKESDKLSFLRVDFVRNLEGNINKHEIRFLGNVRTVYGPVLHWEDTLDGDDPAGLGESGVLLKCDQLTVTEVNFGPKSRGTIEMEALGNTLAEGNVFTARAYRMAYAQAKDLIVLEGNGRTDAQLWRQSQVGGPTSRAAARKILYWRSANRVEVDDARFLDLNQVGRGLDGQRR